MPSAASSSQSRSRGGLARPDTAPSSTKRSVRFSDNLGLGDELFGSERPSTAPGERSGRRQAKRGEKDENINGSYLDDNKKPPEGNKPARKETTSNGKNCKCGTVSEAGSNRPFPSSLVPLFQNESKCKTFHMKISSACGFIFMKIEVIFIRMVLHLDSL